MKKGKQISLEGAAVLTVGWPTPGAMDGTRGAESRETKKARGSGGVNLAQAAKLAGWQTPNAMEGGATCRSGKRRGELLLGGQARSCLTGWPTPRAEDSQSAGAHRGAPDTLTSAARLAGWTTPAARDWKDTPGMAITGTNPDGSTRNRVDMLARQAALAIGPTSESSAAATPGKVKSRGALNPEHSRWLMGFPAEWSNFAPTGTPSCRKRPPRSSAHFSNRSSKNDAL